MKCYRRPLGISYKERTTDNKVKMRITQVDRPHMDLMTIIKRMKLKWYGHVSRSSGLAKTILKGTVGGGQAKEDYGHVISKKRQASASPTHRQNGQASASSTHRQNGQASASPTHRQNGQASASPTHRQNGQASASPTHRQNGQASDSPTHRQNGQASASPTHREQQDTEDVKRRNQVATSSMNGPTTTRSKDR